MYAIQTKKITPSIPENSSISVNWNASPIQDEYKAKDIEEPKIQSPEEEEEKQVDAASFQQRIDLTFWRDLEKAKTRK